MRVTGAATATGWRLVVVVVVEVEPLEPPKELLTVCLMKGVNWEMILATRSPSLELEDDEVVCWLTALWTTGRTD